MRYDAPEAGERRLSVGDLTLSWIAHDYFHIRRICKLRREYLAHAGAPWSPGYAGPPE